MSDYRFGGDYKLDIYPKEAMGYDGLDMDKVESVEIEWVDFVRKPDDKSRWHELFGTPERAARTLSTTAKCFEPVTACRDCVYKSYCDTQCDYGALLEWLSGDA